jgi:hypothetical protein
MYLDHIWHLMWNLFLDWTPKKNHFYNFIHNVSISWATPTFHHYNWLHPPYYLCLCIVMRVWVFFGFLGCGLMVDFPTAFSIWQNKWQICTIFVKNSREDRHWMPNHMLFVTEDCIFQIETLISSTIFKLDDMGYQTW